jgi:hypothetical protein
MTSDDFPEFADRHYCACVSQPDLMHGVIGITIEKMNDSAEDNYFFRCVTHFKINHLLVEM